MKSGTVLVIDDISVNRLIIKSLLNDICYVIQAASSNEALNIILKAERTPDLILLDIIMPGMNGLEFMELLRNTNYSNIPIMVITGHPDKQYETRAIALGAVDFISRPFNPETFRMRVKNNLELIRLREGSERNGELTQSQVADDSILETLACVIENSKIGGGVNSGGERLAALRAKAEILINNMLNKSKYRNTLLDREYKAIIKAVPFHDIGRIGISDSLLQKPAQLTAEEFDIMKTHTSLGAEIVKRVISENGESMFLKNCYDICLYHHERWDGKGYPEGLSAEHIPLPARISSLLDAYDALIRDRPYRKACSHRESLGILSAGSSSQFDPYLVGCFMEVSEQISKV